MWCSGCSSNLRRRRRRWKRTAVKTELGRRAVLMVSTVVKSGVHGMMVSLKPGGGGGGTGSSYHNSSESGGSGGGVVLIGAKFGDRSKLGGKISSNGNIYTMNWGNNNGYQAHWFRRRCGRNDPTFNPMPTPVNEGSIQVTGGGTDKKYPWVKVVMAGLILDEVQSQVS